MAIHRFGVFLWEQHNQYRTQDAVRTYARRDAADRKAATLDGNYVVRTLGEPVNVDSGKKERQKEH